MLTFPGSQMTFGLKLLRNISLLCDFLWLDSILCVSLCVDDFNVFIFFCQYLWSFAFD